MIVRTSFKNKDSQTSLKVQWLRLDLPLQGLHVRSLIQDLKPKSWPKPQNIGGKKQKQYCTKFNKDLKKKKGFMEGLSYAGGCPRAGASLVAQTVKNVLPLQEIQV